MNVVRFAILKRIRIPQTYIRGISSSQEAVKVEIISTQNVKPSIPTPQHLKNFKLSILDQCHLHMYMGLVHFYLNKDPSTKNESEVEVLAAARREVLKESLSRTLCHLYPLAGEPSHDGLFIECNDKGVYYVEARVRDEISSFLSLPKYDEIERLLPFHPKSSLQAFTAQNCMVMIQVNIFDCGGIALGIYTSHKLIDGQSHFTFLQAWAAQARVISNSKTKQLVICPDLYSAPSIFIQDASFALPKEVDRSIRPGFEEAQRRVMSKRRFVFNASDLVALKAKTRASSRVLAIIGLLWKGATLASQKRSMGMGDLQKPPRSPCLILPMNLRPRIRSRLPMSPYSIGNVIWVAHVHPMSNDSAANGLIELETVMKSMRDSIAEIEDERFIELITGDNGSANIRRILEEDLRNIGECMCNGRELFVTTSLCNGDIYEADFGWGKPIWSTFGGGSELHFNLFLTDTRSGGGIEALVTLNEQDMKMLETDPEILAFATLDPNPLQFDNH